MSITMGQALKSILMFCMGRKDDDNEPETPQEDNSSAGEDESFIKCSRCNSIMESMSVTTSDFVILHIYQCPKCGSVSEFQYDNKTNELIRETHIFTAHTTDTGAFSEIYGAIPYANFSLDRLWSIGGHLCYPALVKTEFADADTSTLIFIRVDSDRISNHLDGFYINEQNIVGEIKIILEQSISQFYNPYLANLPNPEFVYISSPTIRCEALESVFGIRYQHTIDGHTGIYVHRLKIIKDVPLKVCGLEVYVKFTSISPSDTISMSELIKAIDLRSIIMGKNSIETDDTFAVQTYYLTKYMISSVSRTNISKEIRKLFYSDILEFFTKHDSVQRITKDDANE